MSVVSGVNRGMAQETDTLSVLAMDLQPYFWQDEHGTWQGMYTELASALAEEAGLQPIFRVLPWNRALEYLKKGKLDMIPLLSKTPEREEFVHFIGAAGFEQTVLIVRRENVAEFQSIRTLDDLAQDDYRWGIRDRAFYSETFNQRLKTDEAFRKHFESIAKVRLNVEKVKGKRFSGAFVDRVGMSYVLKTDERYKELAIIQVPFFQPTDNYFGVSKRIAPEKLDALRAAYETLKAQGTFEKILAEWVD